MPSVHIQPPNDIYGTFARLNYKPWVAIAEFVDNSTQNFFQNRKALRAAGQRTLTINISYDGAGQTLTVRDNAHGMDSADLDRAMQLACPPPETTGRNEFGMGLKTAACWFGPRWAISTTKLGCRDNLSLTFDIEQLAKSRQTDIDVDVDEADVSAHGTTITVYNLRKPIAGRQIDKVKRLLTSMYRTDLTGGDVSITWNGTFLRYEEPALWTIERHSGDEQPMRQPVNLSVTDPATGEAHIVNGWFGVLQTMSSSHNGFAMIRRGRVIIGGPDDTWRPEALMGQLGSHSWKRLVGELHVDDFPVNFTKDGFAWDGGLEDALIAALKGPMALYRKEAGDLRTRSKAEGTSPKDFKRAVEEVNEGVRNPSFKSDVTRVLTPLPPGMEREEAFEAIPEEEVPATLTIPFPTGEVKATLYVKAEGVTDPWLVIQAPTNEDIDIMLNVNHRFVANCLEDERGRVIISKVALATAIGEQQARIQHGDMIPTDEIRSLLNTILLYASK